MQLTVNPSDYRPRLIIWEIACSCLNGYSVKKLTTKEIFTVMDSITEISKPILILASNHSENSSCDPLDRPDIIDILLYGNSIGLKMIVETSGEKLTTDLRNVLKTIGAKCIRLVINNQIKESIEDGFEQSEDFKKFNGLIDQLKKEGFEIQLGLPIKKFDEREILFIVDYAIRKDAKGIYFHFYNGKNASSSKKQVVDRENIINWIAFQKKLLPEGMYFSPQCIKYGPKHKEDSNNSENCSDITHWCLSGKTFAFINGKGEVQICSSNKYVCGDLTKNNFNFAKIWFSSELYNWLRVNNFNCLQTQLSLSKPIPKSPESKEMFEQI